MVLAPSSCRRRALLDAADRRPVCAGRDLQLVADLHRLAGSHARRRLAAAAPVDGAPLHAEVELVDVDGGAEVDGVERVVATWTAPPSGTVTASGTVDGSADAIDAIQVVASDTGEVVLERRR